MLESLLVFVAANAVELYTAVIATAGVGFWIMDRKAMKAALIAAQGSDANSLRLERQKAEASVERSYAALQMSCQTSRSDWENHHLRNGLTLGCSFQTPEEQKEIARIERGGIELLKQLKLSAPDAGCTDIDELTAYFAAAERTTLEMNRISSHLPKPGRPFH